MAVSEKNEQELNRLNEEGKLQQDDLNNERREDIEGFRNGNKTENDIERLFSDEEILEVCKESTLYEGLLKAAPFAGGLNVFESLKEKIGLLGVFKPELLEEKINNALLEMRDSIGKDYGIILENNGTINIEKTTARCRELYGGVPKEINDYIKAENINMNLGNNSLNDRFDRIKEVMPDFEISLAWENLDYLSKEENEEFRSFYENFRDNYIASWDEAIFSDEPPDENLYEKLAEQEYTKDKLKSLEKMMGTLSRGYYGNKTPEEFYEETYKLFYALSLTKDGKEAIEKFFRTCGDRLKPGSSITSLEEFREELEKSGYKKELLDGWEQGAKTEKDSFIGDLTEELREKIEDVREAINNKEVINVDETIEEGKKRLIIEEELLDLLYCVGKEVKETDYEDGKIKQEEIDNLKEHIMSIEGTDLSKYEGMIDQMLKEFQEGELVIPDSTLIRVHYAETVRFDFLYDTFDNNGYREGFDKTSKNLINEINSKVSINRIGMLTESQREAYEKLGPEEQDTFLNTVEKSDLDIVESAIMMYYSATKYNEGFSEENLFTDKKVERVLQYFLPSVYEVKQTLGKTEFVINDKKLMTMMNAIHQAQAKKDGSKAKIYTNEEEFKKAYLEKEGNDLQTVPLEKIKYRFLTDEEKSLALEQYSDYEAYLLESDDKIKDRVKEQANSNFELTLARRMNKNLVAGLLGLNPRDTSSKELKLFGETYNIRDREEAAELRDKSSIVSLLKYMDMSVEDLKQFRKIYDNKTSEFFVNILREVKEDLGREIPDLFLDKAQRELNKEALEKWYQEKYNTKETLQELRESFERNEREDLLKDKDIKNSVQENEEIEKERKLLEDQKEKEKYSTAIIVMAAMTRDKTLESTKFKNYLAKLKDMNPLFKDFNPEKYIYSEIDKSEVDLRKKLFMVSTIKDCISAKAYTGEIENPENNRDIKLTIADDTIKGLYSCLSFYEQYEDESIHQHGFVQETKRLVDDAIGKLCPEAVKEDGTIDNKKILDRINECRAITGNSPITKMSSLQRLADTYVCGRFVSNISSVEGVENKSIGKVEREVLKAVGRFRDVDVIYQKEDSKMEIMRMITFEDDFREIRHASHEGLGKEGTQYMNAEEKALESAIAMVMKYKDLYGYRYDLRSIDDYSEKAEDDEVYSPKKLEAMRLATYIRAMRFVNDRFPGAIQLADSKAFIGAVNEEELAKQYDAFLSKRKISYERSGPEGLLEKTNQKFGERCTELYAKKIDIDSPEMNHRIERTGDAFLLYVKRLQREQTKALIERKEDIDSKEKLDHRSDRKERIEAEKAAEKEISDSEAKPVVEKKGVEMNVANASELGEVAADENEHKPAPEVQISDEEAKPAVDRNGEVLNVGEAEEKKKAEDREEDRKTEVESKEKHEESQKQDSQEVKGNNQSLEAESISVADDKALTTVEEKKGFRKIWDNIKNAFGNMFKKKEESNSIVEMSSDEIKTSQGIPERKENEGEFGQKIDLDLKKAQNVKEAHIEQRETEIDK